MPIPSCFHPATLLTACLLAVPAIAADAPATKPATTRPDAVGVRERSTPLLRAIVEFRYDDAMALVKGGADVNDRGDTPFTPLFFAVDRADGSLAEALVARGADVNAKCIGGFTPLHQACLMGTPEAVAFLLSKGADPLAAEDAGGDTPLHVAAARDPAVSEAVRRDHARDGQVAAVVDLLLKHKVDVNIKDRDGKTPLDFANSMGTRQMAAALEARGGKPGDAVPATRPATAPGTAPATK